MVQPDIIVRKATLDDLKYTRDVSDMVNHAYQSKDGWTSERDIVQEERCDEELVASFIRQTGDPHVLLFAVEQPHKIVGTLQIQISPEHPSEAGIGFFSVSPFEQSRGIGSKLIRAALEEMKQMGMMYARMNVFENRPELLSWYKKLGFQETGERKSYIRPVKLKDEGTCFLILKKPLQDVE
ncbi:hypothetical protein G6F43_006472 [Rhizopus delemar]|nr:hypothetical protein G6F43_006472 [Rhizopus delemar]